MRTAWQHTLAAWNLAQAGRWDAALEAARQDPGLLEILLHRKGQTVDQAEPVIFGWQSYYRGRYREALEAFLKGTGQEEDGWLKAWAQLGVAKVASDSGWWVDALDWCALAWLTAGRNEHLDLMAQVAGARGEVLLRAGRPLDAAASFAEDVALLGPGNRYAGRGRCYEAHAWSRLGHTGEKAAALAYRLVMHSVGEGVTAAYAAAGMALMAARSGDVARLRSVERSGLEGMPKFWTLVAEARLSAMGGKSSPALSSAAEVLPQEYHAERWWFAGWSRALGSPAFVSPMLEEHFPGAIPLVGLGGTTLVERPVEGKEILNAPWWRENPAEDDPEAWWDFRDSFMP
jgi:hypothetical protein